MLTPMILLSVFATAVLSGVLGMAGGMILMAILVTLLPVAAAMMLHGAVQAFANGSRAWFLRDHIVWRVLPGYTAGALLAVAGFLALAVLPDPALVLMLVGAMPWLARLLPRLGAAAFERIDVTRPIPALLCGATVTSAQLLAGASGPLLDLFYLRSPLTRHEVVASKALTQTLGHLLKFGYYGVLVASLTSGLPVWLFAAAITAAVLGSRIGVGLLDRLDDANFRRVSGWVILSLGALAMIEGGRRLLLTS